MPQELLIAAYVTPVKEVLTKFDDRLSSMMVEFTREMMRTVNAIADGTGASTNPDGCALECYYTTAWNSDAVLEVVLDDPKVEFWSVHAPYGRHFDPSALDVTAREGGVSAYCDAVRFAARLGAKVVVAHPGANVPYGISKTDAIGLAIDPFRRIADLAGEQGIRVAIEPLPKSEVGNSIGEVLEIIERVDRPNVGVNFDVNHLFPPEAIPGMIRQAGSRIVSVHVSDQDGTERHWLPFKGTLDWRDILKALAEIGYAGPLIYETHIHDVERCDQVGAAIVENYEQLIQLASAQD